jgi:hypothetical protein
MSVVSLRPSYNPPLWQPSRAEPTSPPEAPPPSYSAPPSTQERHPIDSFEAAPDTAGTTGSVRSIHQPTPISCGLAALAAVNSTTLGGKSDQELFDIVEANARTLNANQVENFSNLVDLSNGTTPQEMSMLLGQQGQEVVRGFGQFDSDALQEATRSGQFGMLLVDANALHNATQDGEGAEKLPEGQGDLHWLTIDGIQELNGPDSTSEPLYRVKDSDSAQREYTLTRDELENIVNQAKNGIHQTGGGLVVKNRPDVDEVQEKHLLSMNNLWHSLVETLGADDGIGRNDKRGAISS